jgi:hypothetical protein
MTPANGNTPVATSSTPEVVAGTPYQANAPTQVNATPKAPPPNTDKMNHPLSKLFSPPDFIMPNDDYTTDRPYIERR